MLSCGLIGLPGSGKTTLFTLLTGPAEGQTSSSTQARRVARVPDPRVDTLAAHFAPKKVTYAQLEVTDIPGLVPGERSRTAHFLQAVRDSDALVFVLRENPLSELATLEAELILADLAAVKGRIQRLEGGPQGRGRTGRRDETVYAGLVSVRNHLNQGRPAGELEPTPAEAEALEPMGLLSAKPVVWVHNADEENLGAQTGPPPALADAAHRRGVPLVVVSARLEKEIAELAPDEAAAFLADLGLKEPGIARLARAVYERLGLISFLTAGKDEVRAWTIRRGTTAKAAAGKIHSDIERGFIRAEVLSYPDYLIAAQAAFGPSETARGAATVGSAAVGERALVLAKEKGLVRLEGRDYVVQDGDIINFRFNV